MMRAPESRRTPRPRILIVPGRGNSEAGHWESLVEADLPDTARVQQDDWNAPSLEAWSRNIDRAVRALDHRPLVVAHSYGCLAAAYAQIALGTPVGATLFVAPADPQRFGLSRNLFAERLTRPGMLIASASDPWLPLEAAVAQAADWGVECVNLGRSGHINVASGHGDWPLGEAIIESMRSQLGEGTESSAGPLAASATSRSFQRQSAPRQASRTG